MKKFPFSLITMALVLCSCSLFSSQPEPTAVMPTVESPTAEPTAIPPTEEPTLEPTVTPTPVTPIAHLPVNTEVVITSIQMLDASTGWGIGQAKSAYPGGDDHILRTADGGLTWKDITPPQGIAAEQTQSATAFFMDETLAWVIYSTWSGIPEFATVWTTYDGGNNWSPSYDLETSGMMEFFSPGFFSFADEDHGWLLVHAGAGMSHDYIYLYGTTDGGVTWTKLVDPMDASDTTPSMSLYKTGMAFTDPLHGWITYELAGVAPGVWIYGTEDGGITWNPVDLPAPDDKPDLYENGAYSCGVYDLAYTEPAIGSMTVTCMMGDSYDKSSWLYRTDDGGANWEITKLPEPSGDLQMLDEQNGWYVAKKIYRTTNGGASWQSVIPVSWHGQPVFVDMTRGWIVARRDEDIALVRTTNAAVNWDILTTRIAP